MMKGFGRWLLLALVTGLVGCANLPGPGSRPAMRTFVLDPSLAAAVAADPKGPVLQVMVPVAAPGYDDRRMAYSRQAYALSYFAQSEWADAPARLLAPLLQQALENSGRFRAVVGPAAGVSADLRLDTELRLLRQVFPAEGSSHVELELRAQLIDLRGRRLRASRIFTAQATTPSDDAYGGVVAINLALGRMLQDVVGFVADAPQ